MCTVLAVLACHEHLSNMIFVTASKLVVCWLKVDLVGCANPFFLPHGCEWVNVSSGIGSPVLLGHLLVPPVL